MKNTIRYGRILLLLWLAVCLFLSSCAKNPPDYFAYREKSFTAELRGERNGSAFSVWVRAVPKASGTSLSLRYLAPSSLADITVEAEVGQKGELLKDADISCGSVVHTCPAVSLEGLLAPLLRLLAGEEVVSVSRTEEGYVLTLPSDRRLTLSHEGVPLRYADAVLSFEVVWLEIAPLDTESEKNTNL